MLKKFDIKEKGIVQSDCQNNLIDIYITPDENEKQKILTNLDLDEHTLSSALDDDEISRIEFNSDNTFMIWKRPNNYSFNNQLLFNVSSIGFIISNEKLSIILSSDYELYDRREFNRACSLKDYFLKVLFYTIRHFFEHIKAINLMSKEIQDKINTSLENKYLLQMFNLSESLIYYINAISANSTVLTKLRNNAVKMGFSDGEIEVIDDIIIENSQCLKQAEIYSNILSGLMDARGSIVNNNMNTLLKKLTIINVIFLPLNLIAGIGGMSEYSMMTSGIPWQVSYLLLCAAMLGIGWLTAIFLNNINTGGKAKKRPNKLLLK
jgi:magnesium transporter